MLRLEGVSKTFAGPAARVEAVRDVSLTVADGQIHGIIGASGAGKSTLVRCMNLLERPDSGRVWLDDTELTALPERRLRELRRGIGMIFQHFNLMASRTALENVLLPLRGSQADRQKAREKALGLLQLVGLGGRADSYPSQLSGGQKQRVAIARALANDPRLLLCDEATSALDPQTTLSILGLLKELNRKLELSVVIITHEMAVVKEICHQVAVMEDGRVVEQGEVYALFSQPREAVTRRFIDHTSPLQKIRRLIEDDAPVVRLQPGEQILRLRFLSRSASQALVSQIARRFQLDMSIIFGDIEVIGDAPLGGLIVIAGGAGGRLPEALDFLKANGVDVEVIKVA